MKHGRGREKPTEGAQGKMKDNGNGRGRQAAGRRKEKRRKERRREEGPLLGQTDGGVAVWRSLISQRHLLPVPGLKAPLMSNLPPPHCTAAAAAGKKTLTHVCLSVSPFIESQWWKKYYSHVLLNSFTLLQGIFQNSKFT